MSKNINQPVKFDIVLVPDAATGQVTSFFSEFPNVVAVGETESEAKKNLMHLLKKLATDLPPEIGGLRQWYLIENETEYNEATRRFEEIREAKKGTPEHREKMLLVHLISTYELAGWDLPEIDTEKLAQTLNDEYSEGAKDNTSRTVTFDKIESGGRVYFLSDKVDFDVYSFSGGRTLIENRDLDIFAFGETAEGARKDLSDQFNYTYQRVGKIPNECLSGHLLQAKKIITGMVVRVEDAPSDYGTFSDNTLMPFGKKKGIRLGDISDGYFLAMYDGGRVRGPLKEYIENRVPSLRALKEKHKG